MWIPLVGYKNVDFDFWFSVLYPWAFALFCLYATFSSKSPLTPHEKAVAVIVLLWVQLYNICRK